MRLPRQTWQTAGRLVAAALWCLAAGAGCCGSAHIELASLDCRSIDPPAPRAVPLDFDCCYWWTGKDGQVWIAMQYARWSPFGRYGRFSFKMSLMLEKLPAGRERFYQLSGRSFRAVARGGPTESRFTSTAGIVVLSRQPGDRLRGSFRLFARRQVSRLLGGWRRPTGFLAQGTFVAMHDEARGRPIAQATESQGWDRQPSTSQLRHPAKAERQPGTPATSAPADLEQRPVGQE